MSDPVVRPRRRGAAVASREAPRTGPHRVLIALYALFTLAAGARSAVQLIVDAAKAPVAYCLSALAACTYAAGWYAISRAARGSTGLASVLLWVELSGVVSVGTLSLAKPEWFPDASVWSNYGAGYGYVPALLPVLGLVWLRSQIRRNRDGSVAATGLTADLGVTADPGVTIEPVVTTEPGSDATR